MPFWKPLQAGGRLRGSRQGRTLRLVSGQQVLGSGPSPLGGKTRPGRELRGYTTGMKTAVSVPDEVYAQAEELARRTGRTRSEIYSTALRDYLADHQPVPVTAAMDQALDAIDPGADPFLDAAAHETLAGVEW